MMKKLFLIIPLILFIQLSELSFAELTEIETSIINQDYAKAQFYAEEALSKPLTQQARDQVSYYLALSYLHSSQYLKAKKIFKELIKGTSDQSIHDKAYLGMFDYYYMQGHYKQARKTIRKFLKGSEDSEFLSLIYLKAARINLKLAKWKDAQHYLLEIVDKYPDSYEYHTAKQLLEEKQYFAVQVGAFLEQIRAEKLVGELQQNNEYAYIIETKDRNDRIFYRVRVGQIIALNEARTLETQLSKQGYPTQIYP